MKLTHFVLLVCLHIGTHVSYAHTQMASNSEKLVLLDTSYQNKYIYQTPFFTIARSVGYQPIMLNAADIADGAVLPTDTQTLFVIIEPSFLKNLTSSPVAKKIMDLFTRFSRQHNKKIGLFCAPGIGRGHRATTHLMPLLQHCGFTAQTKVPQVKALKSHKGVVDFLINKFYAYPLELRCYQFHKSLAHPTPGKPFISTITPHMSQPVIKPFQGQNNLFSFLPLNQKVDSKLKPLNPFGLYYFDPRKNNHLLFSNSLLLTFASITESFHICPTDFSLRKQLLQQLTSMLWQFKLLSSTHHRQQNISTTLAQTTLHHALPTSLNKPERTPVKLANADHIPRKIAWMEVDKAHESQQFIDTLLDSQLDALWISIAPNAYYSPIGALKKQKKTMLETLGRFNKLLLERAREKNKPLPKILIGFEISNNYAAKLPKNKAYDLYGTKYEKCNDPLDEKFWQHEVTQPLVQFAADWNKVEVGHGVPLSGLILDLEMYFARPGMFSPLSGFNKKTLSQFDQSISSVKHLVEHRRVKQYFQFLHQRAHFLATRLKDSFNAVIPNPIIGCYAPNININWFYHGLYQGLSSTRNPLLFMSFNTEFARHQPWLKKANIQMVHAGALMLSKFRKLDDLSWIDYTMKHHNGLWLNRYSRMIEKYKEKEWYTLEQTPYSPEEKRILMQRLAAA